MSLILRRKARGMAPAARRRAAPKDLVLLLCPGHLHLIDLVEFEVDGVPAIRVLVGAAVIIVARDPDVHEAAGAGGAEDGVEHGERAPVRKKVALGVVLVGVRAKVEGACGGGGCKVQVGGRGGVGKVVFELCGEDVAERGEETTSGVDRGTGAAPGLPDGAVCAPVWAKGPAEHCFDTDWVKMSDVSFGRVWRT